jgi:opacity protein-like surface antigen
MRCIVALSVALVLVSATAGQAEEEDAKDFGRSGFYVGVGGSYASDKFKDEVSSDLDEITTEMANASAESEFIYNGEQLTPPFRIGVTNVDLDNELGANARFGYRLRRYFAFELEGEWLSEWNTSFNVPGSTGAPGTAKLNTWVITANARVFPFTGRIQPFAVFGLGAIHTQYERNVQTVGLTTTTNRPAQCGNPGEPACHVVSGDFILDDKDTVLTGTIRVGGGVDIYATENIALEIKADYVSPFIGVKDIKTDYISLSWGILYRF